MAGKRARSVAEQVVDDQWRRRGRCNWTDATNVCCDAHGDDLHEAIAPSRCVRYVTADRKCILTNCRARQSDHQRRRDGETFDVSLRAHFHCRE